MHGTGITEGVVVTPRHVTSFIEAGPKDGPAIVFTHGWPELAISWRHQLPAMAALGFRAIAPDMRGYGRSSVYKTHADYRLEEIVRDMVELLDGLGIAKAVFVGHDWGSPVAWSMARHHPDRVPAVASLCVPYETIERGVQHVIGLVDREVYPADRYPAGQWDYMLFYEESYDRATKVFQANVANTVKALFRKGDPSVIGQPAITSEVRRHNGWLGGVDALPDMPHDPDVLTETDLSAYVAALSRNGFFGPDSWYMNHQANTEFTSRAPGSGRLDMPVLFLDARYDFVCQTLGTRLADPMVKLCPDLTRQVVDSGHWMAQERPLEVNAALAKWLATKTGIWSYGY
jgi:pimeloyl-ACP methyl ester carboxylesterase